jgi:D-methionine transport system permease protein
MTEFLPPEIVRVLPEFQRAIGESATMISISMTAALLLGTPIGVLLHIMAPGGLIPRPGLAQVVGWIVNTIRSFPFVILLIAIIPLTRLIVGRAIGPVAASVPLSLAAIPFFARLVEQALREVPRGIAEAAASSGASVTQVIRKVLLPEALPGLIASFTTTVISFIAFSATAGLVGGGGIGDLAIRYGYNRFIDEVMYACVLILIVVVQIVQFSGSRMVRLVDKR